MSTRLEIETRPLGRSGIEIPRVALGCGNFGGVGSSPELFGAGLDQQQAFALMDAAWELGITHFDTADAYGGGRSESTIGAWIRSRRLRPLITTKTYNPMDAGADHGLAPERVQRQLHSSLERLGVDQVDLYLTHDFDPQVAPATVVETFELLREQGLIRASGVSNYHVGQLRVTLEAGPLDAIQNCHSLLVRDDDAELVPLCAREGVAYIAFSPLAGGWLTGKYRRDEPYPPGSRMTQRPDVYDDFVDDTVFDGLLRLQERAAQRGVSMAALSLSWLLAERDLTAIVVGPMRVEHLEPLREALAHPLDAAGRAEIGALMVQR